LRATRTDEPGTPALETDWQMGSAEQPSSHKRQASQLYQESQPHGGQPHAASSEPGVITLGAALRRVAEAASAVATAAGRPGVLPPWSPREEAAVTEAVWAADALRAVAMAWQRETARSQTRNRTAKGFLLALRTVLHYLPSEATQPMAAVRAHAAVCEATGSAVRTMAVHYSIPSWQWVTLAVEGLEEQAAAWGVEFPACLVELRAAAGLAPGGPAGLEFLRVPRATLMATPCTADALPQPPPDSLWVRVADEQCRGMWRAWTVPPTAMATAMIALQQAAADAVWADLMADRRAALLGLAAMVNNTLLGLTMAPRLNVADRDHSPLRAQSA